jgi:hypothetical protein
VIIAVTRFVKRQRKPLNTPQNKPPPNIPNIVVKHVILLVLEAIGVVGIFIPDCMNEEEQHKQQISIKNGAALLIIIIFYNILRK